MAYCETASEPRVSSDCLDAIGNYRSLCTLSSYLNRVSSIAPRPRFDCQRCCVLVLSVHSLPSVPLRNAAVLDNLIMARRHGSQGSHCFSCRRQMPFGNQDYWAHIQRRLYIAMSESPHVLCGRRWLSCSIPRLSMADGPNCHLEPHFILV
ncbi:hypothetical protein GQ53DRAFT_251078 [Thozetella sp. PMI_491]|nr:hypothetical protein GQ53DRAFT_251078 [Thozetella sp. PMI_491]